jgi:hypothetical protein
MAAAMVVVMRSLFSAMPVLFRGGSVMVVVVTMAAGLLQQALARSMVRSRRETAGVQPGEHADNSQPCEKHSHQQPQDQSSKRPTQAKIRAAEQSPILPAWVEPFPVAGLSHG